MNKSLLLFFLFPTLVLASDFCVRTQSELKEHLMQEDSRIAFKNGGGLFNGGVCWWHSRLQRASAYLIKFAPEKNPPTVPEVNQILTTLVTMKRVVTIPGYRDFKTFTHDFQGLVQAYLDRWQRYDGFYNLEWIRGISGKAELSPELLREHMKGLYSYYKSSPTPLWIMAQIKGITSHSLLVLKMTETENGYDLEVIDSNHPQETIALQYHDGDRSLHARGERYTFIPYVGFQNDFRLISRALKSECGSLAAPLPLDELQDGAIETSYLQY